MLAARTVSTREATFEPRSATVLSLEIHPVAIHLRDSTSRHGQPSSHPAGGHRASSAPSLVTFFRSPQLVAA